MHIYTLTGYMIIGSEECISSNQKNKEKCLENYTKYLKIIEERAYESTTKELEIIKKWMRKAGATVV